MSVLKDSLASIGPVRFLKLLHDTIWVSFEDPSKAVEAVTRSPLSVCGHELSIRQNNNKLYQNNHDYNAILIAG